MRISDWSSDVCSSDLEGRARLCAPHVRRQWLAGDRRDAPLDRGNPRGGDQARRRPGRRMTLLLASQSSGRAAMLRAAGLAFETSAAHVDEEALTASLLAAGQTPRNIADALAEAKAVKISSRLPGVTVIGADSTLALDDGSMLSKPDSPEEAAEDRKSPRLNSSP